MMTPMLLRRLLTQLVACGEASDELSLEGVSETTAPHSPSMQSGGRQLCLAL
jgi:hypothetical protein